MTRRLLTAALIVLHVLTIVHVASPRAQEGWLIRHQPVTSAQTEEPIVIRAELEGTTAGVLMYIMARKVGKKDFSSFPMTLSKEHLFEGQIPAKWSTTEGLEYYLRLQDPVGRMLARYPEDESFISIAISTPEPEEIVSPPEEVAPEPKPEAEPVEGEAAVPPSPEPVTVPAEEPRQEAAAPPQEATPEEPKPAVETPTEPSPEKEVAEAPSLEAAPEEPQPTTPVEKPTIVTEEKKGGLKTWHWLGLGALAVVGIAAVAMSGGDGNGGDGHRPSASLPDPPDHP
jgi:hypothetical protein